jgi:hypothetical protein
LKPPCLWEEADFASDYTVRKSVAAGRMAATFVATRLAGIFPFPDILQSEAKSGPVRSQQMLLKRRTFGFSTSGFHFRYFFSPKLFYTLP